LNTTVLGFKLESFFSHWHCIGIKENIDLSRPYKINIGELPLVVWQNKETGKLTSAINICKHMGSKLDNGVITNNGCLKCQYHGLENSHEDRFGETIIHDGKIFWSYKPITYKPYSIPFFNNRNFVTSFLEMDMECSLTDSAYNTMDLRHPENVHNKIVGFGNNIPPQNIKYYKYNDSKRIGLSFNYFSNKVIRKMNKDTLITKNFHMYIYPSFSWSKVTFNKNNKNNDLIIGVDLLPLNSNDKYLNLENVIDHKLQLELVPFGSPDFNYHKIGVKNLNPFTDKLLSIIKEAPRKYVIFCGRVFEHLLNDYIQDKTTHSFRLTKKDGTHTKSDFQAINIQIGKGDRKITACIAPQFAKQGYPVIEYGRKVKELYGIFK
jgi:nitrite reductase/ring-hydroxylating ferredoxin subunit